MLGIQSQGVLGEVFVLITPADGCTPSISRVTWSISPQIQTWVYTAGPCSVIQIVVRAPSEMSAHVGYSTLATSSMSFLVRPFQLRYPLPEGPNELQTWGHIP